MYSTLIDRFKHNYDLFYKIGNKKTSRYSDYNSNNVEILSVKEVEKTLRALDLIK